MQKSTLPAPLTPPFKQLNFLQTDPRGWAVEGCLLSRQGWVGFGRWRVFSDCSCDKCWLSDTPNQQGFAPLSTIHASSHSSATGGTAVEQSFFVKGPELESCLALPTTSEVILASRSFSICKMCTIIPARTIQKTAGTGWLP